MKKLLLGIGIGIGVVTALTLSPVIDFKAVESTSAASESQPLPERIPFTNKDVTPGDPESYIGTYGQCPFYENAGEKGCYPPSDIICNADWSKCELKKESEPINVPVNDTRSTEGKKEQPTSSSCSN